MDGSSFHLKESGWSDGVESVSIITRRSHFCSSASLKDLQNCGHHCPFCQSAQTKDLGWRAIANKWGNTVTRGFNPSHTSNQKTVDLPFPRMRTAPMHKSCIIFNTNFQNWDPFWQVVVEIGACYRYLYLMMSNHNAPSPVKIFTAHLAQAPIHVLGVKNAEAPNHFGGTDGSRDSRER